MDPTAVEPHAESAEIRRDKSYRGRDERFRATRGELGTRVGVGECIKHLHEFTDYFSRDKYHPHHVWSPREHVRARMECDPQPIHRC